MGMQKNFTAPSGVMAPQCYVYVEIIRVVDKQATFQIAYYYTKQNKVEGNPPIHRESDYTFVIDDTDKAPPYRKQAYRCLKEREDFAEAIDILEEGQTP